VGIFFCTQAATDIPAYALGQLGNRIQHALRAFTPNDAEALRQTVKTYPKSEFYEIDQVLTQLGTGQALITVLNDKGIPTEVVATHLIPPRASMEPLDDITYQQIIKTSDLYKKYYQSVDNRSADEIITDKIKKDRSNTIRTKQKEENKVKTRRTGNRQTPMEAAGKTLIRTLAAGAGRVILAAISTFLLKKKKP